MLEEIGAQITDDALAKRHHEIEARGGGERERRGDRDHRAEIGVHGAGAFGREAVVDHAAHRERQRERRSRREKQRDESESDRAFVSQGVWQQGPQRRERGAQTAIRFAGVEFDGAQVSVLISHGQRV
jgi:hypothetical protein